MIGCLRTRVRKQPIIALYFEFENELKFYNLEAWSPVVKENTDSDLCIIYWKNITSACKKFCESENPPVDTKQNGFLGKNVVWMQTGVRFFWIGRVFSTS